MGQAKGPRAHSAEFKLRAVERMRAGENVSALASELRVRRKLLYEWKQLVEQGRPLRTMGRPARTPASPKASDPGGAERVRELEALVGRLTLENRFFKGALESIEELRQARGASSSVASSPKSKR
jgi:transposase-like protein